MPQISLTNLADADLTAFEISEINVRYTEGLIPLAIRDKLSFWDGATEIMICGYAKNGDGSYTVCAHAPAATGAPSGTPAPIQTWGLPKASFSVRYAVGSDYVLVVDPEA